MALFPSGPVFPPIGGPVVPGLSVDLRLEHNPSHVFSAAYNGESPKLHASGSVTSVVDARARVLESIHSMINKYDSGRTIVNRPLEARILPQKERVVVTGTTGALGSYLLAQLLESERVEKVWGLNRRSRGMEQRQRASFEDKGLDVGLLKSEKLVLAEADLEDGKLGLEAGVYEEIRSTATIIIHNAWQVNFKLPLELFEPSIKGVRNLLDLAFSSTASIGLPRFVFTSSFSAAGFRKPGRDLKEVYLVPEDAATAIGYGQSKFVTEKLLEPARGAGLETCIVRLGQLTGDAVSGSWPITNWVPLIIASSVSVGCLPGATGNVSWLPLAIASRSILDICTSCSGLMPPVIHPSHPHPIKWARMFAMFAEALEIRNGGGPVLPVVPFSEWNERVKRAALAFEGSQSDRYRRFPSTKIQSTIEAMTRADEELRSQGVEVGIEAVGLPRLDSSEAERLSETLRNATPVCQEHVEKWVGYWVKMGLFRRTNTRGICSRL